MGQALISAAQWTSAKDGSGGKLELTPLNEELLNSILRFVEGFTQKNPDEGKLVFKKPLVWETTLSANSFSGFKEENGCLVSEEKKDDVPLFKLQKRTLSIMTMELAEMVLRVAGDKKITELRLCLEANRDPVVNMLGERFGTVQGDDNSIMRYVEEIRKEMEQLSKAEPGQSEKQQQELKEKNMVLSMRLKLVGLDQQLLNQSIMKISTQVRLTPEMVETEMTLLTDLSGDDDEKCVLEYIRYYGESFVYKNGCRAQPWRQLHGDICYIEAKPHDCGSALFVTANTSGYFINKGPDPEKPGQLNYERSEQDTFRDLVTLLKAKSPRFAQIISKQEFALHEKPKDDRQMEVAPADEEDGDATARSEQQTFGQKDRGADDKEKQKKQGQQKKKLEPSLKWKALGMDENQEEDEKKEMQKQKPKPKRRGSSQRKQKTPVEPADSFSESSTESEEEEEAVERRAEANADLPSEYWQIQKLVKYLKGGNQTATIIALCSLRDFNLAQETCQLAIRDVGGLEVLINLLDTEEVKCKSEP